MADEGGNRSVVVLRHSGECVDEKGSRSTLICSSLFRATLALIFFGVIAKPAMAQHIPGYNYDETKIPSYVLLDPLQLNDGSLVKTPEQWWRRRRPEIVRLFEENVFGRTPDNARVRLRAHVVEINRHALAGRAVRKQIDLYFTPDGDRGARMRLLLYLPAHARKRSAVVLGLNFGGNQTVLDDPGILPTPVWTKP